MRSTLSRKGRAIAFTMPASGNHWLHLGTSDSSPLESPQSNTRYFVTAGGVRRAYAFKKAESRMITEAALVAQLHASGFVGTSPRDQGAPKPT
jgi:hypothetical protein